jgi:hypothetical protein
VSGSANISNNLVLGGTFGNAGNASVASLACTGLTMNNPLTVNSVSTTIYNPYLNSNSYQLLNFGVNTGVNYNAAYHGFFNYSNNSPSNYASLGIWGNSIGTQTFNAMANGNFGITKTTPGATLKVNGTYKTTGNATIVGALSATTLSGSLPFTSLTTVPSLLSNASSLGWSNIVEAPAYVGASNTSLSIYSLQTPSNTLRMYTSNFCVGYPSDTNLGIHVWANGVDGASFDSNGGGSSNQGVWRCGRDYLSGVSQITRKDTYLIVETETASCFIQYGGRFVLL